MKKLARAYWNFTGIIDRIFKFLSIILITAMALAVVMQVIMRYIFQNPPVWTEEIARYLMIWGSFFAMGYLIRNWQCVQVDFIVQRMGPKWGKAMKIFLRAVVFVFAVAMVILCLKVYPTVTRTQKTPAMNISMYYPTLGIVIGMALISLQSLAAICAQILDIKPESETAGE